MGNYINRVPEISMHWGWVKILATIFFFTISLPTAMGQVIDFSNVTPDQGTGHGGPITATGPDGVQVTVEFINIETSDVVNSGLYSAQDCTGTSFEGVFFTGDATGGCATSDLDDNKGAVRLTFSEAVDISRIDLSKFSDFSTGFNYDKEIRFFEGTPTTEFSYNANDPGPTNFDFSGLMNISENQAITETSVGFSDVTQIWFYAAYVNIPDFPDFEDVAIRMNWVVDQIHYGAAAADPPTVTTDPPTSITSSSATLGGNVTDDGGATVTASGVVYNTSANPDTGDNVVQISSGTGSFSQTVDNLDHGTTYYTRAYAINSEGTSYGSQHSFTTSVEVESIVRHSPSSSQTNENSVVYEVNLSGSASGLSTSNFNLTTTGVSGASVSNLSGSGDTYEVTVNTGSGDGTVRLDLANSSGVSPAIHNVPFTSGETYTINKTEPTVAISSTESSPTNASTIPISIDFSEGVTGFVIGDITVTGGSPSNFSGSGSSYTVDVTPSGDGTITVDVPAGVAQDAAGNDNEAATQFSIVSDQIPPEITSITAQQLSPTNETDLEFELVFSKDVQVPAAGDFQITNASFQSVIGSGNTFTLVVNPDDENGAATIAVEVLQGGVEDLAGNALANTLSESVDYDGVRPEFVDHTFFDSASAEVDSVTNDLSFSLDLEFDKDLDAASFRVDSLNITNDNPDVSSNILTGHSVTDQTLTLDFEIPAAERDNIAKFDFDIWTAIISDLAGNFWIGSESFELVYNGTRPTVTLSTAAENTNEPVIPITITFSEEVDEFTHNDINVINGSVDSGSFSQVAFNEYEVNIIPQNTSAGQNYDITISIPDEAVEDLAGNLSEESDDLVITFDTTPFTAAISSDEEDFTNESSFNTTITFNRPATDFDIDDISESNATLSNFSPNAEEDEFTVTVSPDSEGEVTLDIAAGVTQDAAGNDNEAAQQFSIVFDETPPTPVVSSTAPSLTNVSPIPVEIDFGEPVIDFTQSLAEDAISASNGTGFSIEDFESDAEDEVYTLNLIPDADDTFTIELAQGVVSDRAGNDNEASNAVEATLNSNRPEITFRAVEEGGSINDDELESPTNTDFFTLFLDFGEELASFNVSDIGADNASLDDFETVNASEGLYSVRVEPVDDGEITITIADGEVQDLAGNDNEEGQFQITSNRTLPTITSIEPASGINDPTNQSPFDIVITFNEEIADFDESELSVTNGSATVFSTTDNIAFTVTVEPDDVTTSSSTLEISVPAGVFTDLADNENEADTENFTIGFGDTRPTADLASSESDPTNADDFEVTLTVTEIFGQAVSNIDASDFTLERAQITHIDASSNPDFVLTVEPQEEGEVSIQLNENALTDAAGNQNKASNKFSITYDVSPPAVAISSDESDHTNADDFEVTFTFSKPVFGFEQGDIVVTNADLSNFSGSDGDTEFTVTVTPDGDGLVTVDVPEGAAQDNASNDSEAADTFEITSNRTPPVAEIESDTEDPTSEQQFTITITFNEEVSGLELTDVEAENAELSEFQSIDAQTYTIAVRPDADGVVTITLPESSAIDAAGNPSEESTFSITYIASPPPVVLSGPEDESADLAPRPEFNWQEAERATSYQLQIATTSEFEENNLLKDIIDIASLSYQAEQDLNPDQKLYWRVRGSNDGVLGEWSDIWSFTTVPLPPEQVVLSAPVDSAGSISLQPTFEWNAADRAYSYEFQLAESDDFSDPIETADEITSTSLDGTTELDYYQGYFWRVRAQNTGGTGEWSETGEFVTLAQPPSPLFPADGSDEISIAPALIWSTAHEETRFEIELTREDGVTTQLESNQLSRALSGLTPETDYSWRVRLHDEVTSSEWSSQFEFTTRPDPVNEIVEIQVSFDGSTDSDGELSEFGYQFFGLPGSDQFEFEQIFTGEQGQDWRVIRDIGTSTDYFQEYDPQSAPFTFRPGEGFWVISREDVEFNSEVSPNIPDEQDQFLINLHPGWNMISNPFTVTVSWQDVLDRNEITTDLLSFQFVLQEADELRPGVGYYFYNDPEWGLEHLAIPYSPSSKSGQSTSMKQSLLSSGDSQSMAGQMENGQMQRGAGETQSASEESSDEFHIRLTGSFTGPDEQRLAIETHFDYTDGAVSAGHPGLDLITYGAAISESEEIEGREELYRHYASRFEETGSEYRMLVKAPVGEQLTWQADFSGLDADASILLVNPATRQSHLLTGSNSVNITVSEPEVFYTIFTGSQASLEEIQENQLPEAIALMPNYPNPFSHSTNIRYALVEDAHVRLEVYDILGRKVELLVDSPQSEGWHVTQFNAGGLASGVYLYRLSVDNTLLIEKMTLIR